ncbi:kinesin motor domain-domain-containing protein [Absidia repens]|uniref:Kinesin-like protein n=1 Tax=Absidia repens TaxID=90262 RepID=A0A1X2IHH3_9FUNG|nr:kinesin motor domain-domain-containing protein [Absidia repens]
MTSDGTSVVSPTKGQGIAKAPTIQKTAHHSASRRTKSPGQRRIDLNDTPDTSIPPKSTTSLPVNYVTQPEKDPIKAYLRIRPLPSTQPQPSSSYLKVLDDQYVSLIPPEDTNAYRKRQGASDQYQFTKIFTNSTSQKQLFEETTLPLLQSFIHGNNALIFAYGVTNSGKTFTMLGNELDAGIVPRTIHILFHNLQHRLSQARVKPVMHSTIQSYDLNHASEVDDEHENRSLLLDVLDTPDYNIPSDNKYELDVDARFEYGIWITFAEIYNEKVYDLLESPNNKKRTTRRTSLPLKYEYRSGYKYVAGLKHIRVKSAKEAYTVIQKGQQNRVVFSTLMNQSSSRSHSIFTISLVRCPIDQDDYVIEDPAYATMSKLSIVDLAGSERYRNTFNQGQRLKEAGNINKSLMVLGQCMETLRMNQIKIDSGKRPIMVPFRQSKLTELFKNTFEGNGKVAIVVNINPFDTGFDENSHVMKFAAIAKEVTTVQQQQQQKLALHDISDTVYKRQRRTTTDSNNHLELRNNKTTSSQHHDDTFVNSLLEQMECLRDKWLDAEARYRSMESDIRQQISSETKLELGRMEEMYMSLLRQQNKAIEMETQIDTRLETLGNVEENEESPDRPSLLSLKTRQQQLFLEIDKLHVLLKDDTVQKQSLLDKISALENDKAQEQATTKRLNSNITQLKAVINNYRKNSPLPKLPSSMISDGESQHARSLQRSDSDMLGDNNIRGLDGPDGQYANFLELRKQLRRSVFKREELLEDAESTLHEIEQFENVTFDLVKNTKMGKLLKLITQEEFKSDPYLIQHRALELFKRFARLPRPHPDQQQPSLANSTKHYSNLDDPDHTHQDDYTENTLMDDFCDEDDDDDDDIGDNGNDSGNANGKAPGFELFGNQEHSLDGGNACEPMLADDGDGKCDSDTFSSDVQEDRRSTRKRRRTLRS